MARPPRKEFNLKERIEKLRKAGFTVDDEKSASENAPETEDNLDLAPLPERIKKIIGIIQDKPVKSTTMNYLILYDISNNKVRTLIAKYLESKGCIRIQKSVFLCHSTHKKFDEIKSTLVDINDAYANADSIILIPINVSDARSMKLIGQNVNIDQIIDPPNTVFI